MTSLIYEKFEEGSSLLIQNSVSLELGAQSRLEGNFNGLSTLKLEVNSGQKKWARSTSTGDEEEEPGNQVLGTSSPD